MSEANIVLPALSNGQVMILWLVLISAIIGLGYGLLLVRTVLRADPGPKSMTDVSDAVEQGATLCCGGDRPPRLHAGYYLSPAVLTNVDTALALYREEVFGPAVCVAPFDAVDEAIAAANDSHYGLAAYLWTSNSELALRLAGRLRAGTVAINSPVIRDTVNVH